MWIFDMNFKTLVISFTTSLLFYSVAVGAQRNLVRSCYQFTWLGPRFNNESIFMNATCQEATRLATGVPCRQPLVVSYDGTWPDVEYIWTHHAEQATCRLAPNDVCAQFTYFFDGHVENSTYMCSRGVDNHGQAVTSGCYEQRNGTFMTRACFCRPVPGGVPCNDTTRINVFYYIYFFAFVFVIINQRLFMT